MDAYKAPMFLSPRWFWMVLKALGRACRPKFWKEAMMDPEKQAVWQVSSFATLANVFGITTAIAWCEIHAPWVLTVFAAVGSALKAVGTFFVAVALAVWNVSTNS